MGCGVSAGVPQPGTTAPGGLPGTTAVEWSVRYGQALMGNYGTPQRVLVRGEGPYVWDASGKRYLDLLAGIAVNALGHAHPTLVSAVSAQLGTLGHVSNFFATPTQITLAERLLDLAADGGAPAGSRVFLANTGTEANEAAFKMARRTGTLWEHDDTRASCNHGFASHVAHLLYRDAMGLQAIDVLRREIRVSIPEGSLSWCRGSIPLKAGTLTLSWWKENGRTHWQVRLPEGYTLKTDHARPAECVRHP